jgi:hypothetical protein
MGGGGWDVGSYTRTNAANAAAGRSTFDYSKKVKAGTAPQKVHDLLDPTKPAGPTSPFAGRVLIWLDVTGSNFEAARIVHGKLPKLQAYLQQGNFCSDPQINVSAIGDATSDEYPLQFGQFESDNRLDDQIAAIILEGNGGGQMRETYELGAYMAARHVHQEPYELYGKKGFVFFIGDEMPYETIQNDYTRYGWRGHGHTLTSLTGDKISEPLESAEVFAELMEKNHVFFLFQKQGAYRASEITPAWERLIGKENVIVLDEPEMVVEVIAAIVARFEGELNADETARAMIQAGGDTTTVKSAVKALARVEPGKKGGRIATITGDIDVGGSGATRL